MESCRWVSSSQSMQVAISSNTSSIIQRHPPSGQWAQHVAGYATFDVRLMWYHNAPNPDTHHIHGRMGRLEVRLAAWRSQWESAECIHQRLVASERQASLVRQGASQKVSYQAAAIPQDLVAGSQLE